MPFYDALCPLVPENEKRAERVTRGRKGKRVRDKETTHYLLCPFMTFYALWYPRMKKGRKGHKGQKG